ncbi:MAG TPA: DDE-type integrase/transposase/recombinase, partial [Candidatus Nanoarchaeia archaeon]|nr:DDE-type integrase/transposase/recombinase [Candidatus Nanoarchaeia archaeon]
MDERQTKGEGMINNGIKPIIVDTENFLMPSASNPAKKYHVQRGTAWKCECPDFQYRGVICKHIHATSLFLKVRAKVTETSETQIKFAEQENELDEYSCQFCDSANIRKDGIRKNKIRVVQRFKCLDCKKRFVCEPIKFLKCDTKIICLVMDLYYKGLSLRDVKDTLQQFYGFDIHHETIRRWIRKFSRILNEYTNKLSPQVSSSWNADEQMIPTKKHNDFIYTWNVLDNQTRYLLASRATPTRDKWDAYEVMKLAGENAKLRPSLVTTDKNPSYGIGIHKAFNFKKKADRVMHRSILGHRRYFNNNVIERYHSQFREFDKVRRGINKVPDYTDG